MPEESSSDDSEPKTGASRLKQTPKERYVLTRREGNAVFEEIPTRTSTEGDLGLSYLAVGLDDSTHVLSRFLTFVRKHDVYSNAPYVYTPDFHHAESVCALPFYDPEYRQYLLLVGEVELYDHEMSDDVVTKGWPLKAENICQPLAEQVNLFTMHTSVRRLDSFPMCREHVGRVSNRPCDVRPGIPCSQCVIYGVSAECLHRYTLAREQGYNIITEDICSESQRDLVVMLGHIMVDVMNRAPVELKLDSWKQIEVQAGAPASCAHDHVFIDTVSLILWKRQFHTRLDLRNLGYELNGERKSIWTRHWYDGGGMVPKDTETSVHKACPPGLWLTDPVDLSNGEKGTGLKYVMPYLGIIFDKVDTLIDLEYYAIFSLTERDSRNKAKRTTSRTLEFTISLMIGLVRSRKAMRVIGQEQQGVFASIQEREGAGGMATGKFGSNHKNFLWMRSILFLGHST